MIFVRFINSNDFFLAPERVTFKCLLNHEIKKVNKIKVKYLQNTEPLKGYGRETIFNAYAFFCTGIVSEQIWSWK